MLTISHVNKIPLLPLTIGKDCVTIPSISVAVGADLQLTAQGTGFTDGVLCCTLVRQGKKKKEKTETIWKTTRFVNNPSRDGSWTVYFDVQDVAVHMLSFHSHKDGNAHVEVKIISVAKESGRLAFTPPSPGFTALAIGAFGTVLNAYNPVSCTLTPIDCTTGAATGGPVQNANATFTAPFQWTVGFGPPPPAKKFSGCYLLEATAASEGTISSSGQV